MSKPVSYYKSLDKRTKEYKEWAESKTVDVPTTGLGDLVEKAIKKTGLDTFVKGKDCGCEERKKKLNDLFSFKIKARCFTEEEYILWGNLNLANKKSISNEERKTLAKLYADVFSLPLYEPCTNCSPKPYITMIKRLDVVYNSYNK